MKTLATPETSPPVEASAGSICCKAMRNVTPGDRRRVGKSEEDEEEEEEEEGILSREEPCRAAEPIMHARG